MKILTPELLIETVHKQLIEAKTLHYKPVITIWMNSVDVETLMKWKRFREVLPPEEEWSFMLATKRRYPSKLFGEKLIVSDDTPVGEPIVEVKPK